MKVSFDNEFIKCGCVFSLEDEKIAYSVFLSYKGKFEKTERSYLLVISKIKDGVVSYNYINERKELLLDKWLFCKDINNDLSKRLKTGWSMEVFNCPSDLYVATAKWWENQIAICNAEEE